MELDELKFRRKLALECVRIIRTELKDDPRAPEAAEFYQKQLTELDQMICAIEPPEPVVVCLKTVELFGEVTR